MEGFNTNSFEGTGTDVFEGAATNAIEGLAVAVEPSTGATVKKAIPVVATMQAAGYEVPANVIETYGDEEVSTSEFCRIAFTALNINRREISDKFEINYRTVYGACANMTNTAVDAPKGRATAEATIRLDAEGRVIAVKGDINFIDGVETTEVIDFDALTQVNRKEFILAKVAEGMANADIAKLLQVSHGVVYNATKDSNAKGGSREVMIEVDGVEVKRADYIRQLFDEGKTRSEIKDLLGCEYNVVYAATKTEKSEKDKLADAINAVAKYADKVADVESFSSAIEILKLATLKADEVETTEGATEEAEA